MTRVKKTYNKGSVSRALEAHNVPFATYVTDTGKTRFRIMTGLGERDWNLDQASAYCYGLADMKRAIEREVSVNG